jgi:hypothetical protein
VKGIRSPIAARRFFPFHLLVAACLATGAVCMLVPRPPSQMFNSLAGGNKSFLVTLRALCCKCWYRDTSLKYRDVRRAAACAHILSYLMPILTLCSLLQIERVVSTPMLTSIDVVVDGQEGSNVNDSGMDIRSVSTLDLDRMSLTQFESDTGGEDWIDKRRQASGAAMLPVIIAPPGPRLSVTLPAPDPQTPADSTV